MRAVGEERYHHQHPFHLMMHEGRLSRGQLQAWALNRYYYQSIDPDQGFDYSVARPRSGFSARLAQARGRSRRGRHQRRRHQALAETGGSPGLMPTRSAPELGFFPRPASR